MAAPRYGPAVQVVPSQYAPTTCATVYASFARAVSSEAYFAATDACICPIVGCPWVMSNVHEARCSTMVPATRSASSADVMPQATEAAGGTWLTKLGSALIRVAAHASHAMNVTVSVFPVASRLQSRTIISRVATGYSATVWYCSKTCEAAGELQKRSMLCVAEPSSGYARSRLSVNHGPGVLVPLPKLAINVGPPVPLVTVATA